MASNKIPIFIQPVEEVFIMEEPNGVYTPPRKPKLKGYKKQTKKSKNGISKRR